MQCKNCQKENIQIVSHYVELKEKKVPVLLSLVLGYGVFAIIIGVCLFFIAGQGASEEMGRAVMAISAKHLLISGFIAIVLYGLFKSLIPYRHKTELIAVCLDCGHVEVLQTTESAEPTKK